MATTADIVASLSLDKTEFSRNIAGAQAEAKGLGDVARSIGPALAGIFAVGAIARFAVAQGEAAEKTINTARALGLNAEQYQAATRAADLNASSSEAMAGGLTKLQRALGEAKSGSKSAIADFKALGITQEQLAKMDLAGAIEAVARAWAAGGSDAQTYAAVQGVLGRGALELKATFDDIAGQSLPGMTEEMKKAGLVLSEQVLKNLNEVNSIRERLMARVGVAGGSALGMVAGGLSQIGSIISTGGVDESMFGYKTAESQTPGQMAAAKAAAEKAKRDAFERANKLTPEEKKAEAAIDAVVRQRAEIAFRMNKDRLDAASQILMLEREIAKLREKENGADRLEAEKASLKILEFERDLLGIRKDVAREETSAARQRAEASKKIGEERKDARRDLGKIFQDTRGNAGAYETNTAASGMRSYVENVRAARATHAAGADSYQQQALAIWRELDRKVSTIEATMKKGPQPL